MLKAGFVSMISLKEVMVDYIRVILIAEIAEPSIKQILQGPGQFRIKPLELIMKIRTNHSKW